jgi:hypothetical protein
MTDTLDTKINWFTKSLIAGTLLVAISACDSIRYIAQYDIQSKGQANSQRQTAEKFINQLADKYELKADTKYNNTDTLGYYGKPYHYFRFSFENKGQMDGTITLDYWGGPARTNTYRELLNALTDSVQTNFILLKKDIKETK